MSSCASARVGADACVASDTDVTTAQPGTQVEALLHSATLARRNIAFRPMPIKEAISMIAAAGGKSVVAHLPTLGKKWKTKVGLVCMGLIAPAMVLTCPTCASVVLAVAWGFGTSRPVGCGGLFG